MPGKSHVPDLIERLIRGQRAGTTRTAGGYARGASPGMTRDRVGAGLKGGGLGITVQRSSKIDTFSIADDSDSTFTCTYAPLADSWNLKLNGADVAAAEFSISGRVITIVDAADLFLGAATQGSPWTLEIQYDYLTGVPTTPSGGSYFDLVMAESSLLGYWRLGEASGTTMADSSGNGRDGTYFNTPTLGQPSLLNDDPDTAAYFADVTQEYGAVASASWMDVTALTAEAVIEPHTVGSARAILDRTSYPTGVLSWTFSVVNSQSLGFTVWISGTAHTLTASGVLDSVIGGYRTYHAAATYDGAHMRIYLDGVEVASQAQTGAMDTGTAQLNVGRTKFDVNPNGNFWFEGVIDEAAVYGTALDAATIAAHAAAR